MEALEKLMKEKRDTKLEHTRNRYIRLGIINAYLNEHPRDFSIHRLFFDQRRLTNEICKDHRWEPSSDGFVSRSNYRFGDALEITFDTHKITKKGGKYMPDKSPEALERWSNHLKEFDELGKVDNLIDAYYSVYKEKVDEGLEIAMKFFETFEPDCLDKRIAIEEDYYYRFFYFYGEVGINLLVKWLNKLNEPYEIENFVEEFKQDVNSARDYMDETGDKKYLKSIKLHHEFGKDLLRAIEGYSPRGRDLRIAYKKYLETLSNSLAKK